jgi:hypothetical protein
MFPVDWMQFFFVAVMGASATMSLRTGTLYPFFREVTRKSAPWKFCGWLGFCALVVVGSIAHTIWYALQNK